MCLQHISHCAVGNRLWQHQQGLTKWFHKQQKKKIPRLFTVDFTFDFTTTNEKQHTLRASQFTLNKRTALSYSEIFREITFKPWSWTQERIMVTGNCRKSHNYTFFKVWKKVVNFCSKWPTLQPRWVTVSRTFIYLFCFLLPMTTIFEKCCAEELFLVHEDLQK